MKPRGMLVALVLLVLVAAVSAAPALAVEHIFSGFIQIMPIVSNFNGSFTTDGFYVPEGKPADADTANFVQQRVRLGYTAKASDDLKLVTKFELDYTFWGDDSYGVSRNRGGGLGSDEINIETKHLYLDVKIPSSPVNARIGMQGFDDRFEGVFISADAAGALFSAPYGNLAAAAGFFRLFDDAEDNVFGKETADLFALDLNYKVDDDTAAGCAYYFVRDDRGDDDITLHTLGANAGTGAGPAHIHGFFIYQFGEYGDDLDVSAFVANIGATGKVGPGAVRAELEYASGDDDGDDDTLGSLVTVSGEYGYYSNHLVILGRDEYALTTDNAIVYDVGNNGQGSMLASIGYDVPVAAKAEAGFTLGAGWVAENNLDREGDFLGTEFNADLTYQLYDSLTAVVRGAVVLLGDYFDGVAEGGDDPDNPWDARLVLIYSF